MNNQVLKEIKKLNRVNNVITRDKIINYIWCNNAPFLIEYVLGLNNKKLIKQFLDRIIIPSDLSRNVTAVWFIFQESFYREVFDEFCLRFIITKSDYNKYYYKLNHRLFYFLNIDNDLVNFFLEKKERVTFANLFTNRFVKFTPEQIEKYNIVEMQILYIKNMLINYNNIANPLKEVTDWYRLTTL